MLVISKGPAETIPRLFSRESSYTCGAGNFGIWWHLPSASVPARLGWHLPFDSRPHTGSIQCNVEELRAKISARPSPAKSGQSHRNPGLAETYTYNYHGFLLHQQTLFFGHRNRSNPQCATEAIDVTVLYSFHQLLYRACTEHHRAPTSLDRTAQTASHHSTTKAFQNILQVFTQPALNESTWTCHRSEFVFHILPPLATLYTQKRLFISSGEKVGLVSFFFTLFFATEDLAG